MNIFKGEIHSLDEVKSSLDQDEMKDFTELLEKHHAFLEESMAVITDKKSMAAAKQVNLGRFLHLLTMHAKAEEETLYVGLKAADDRLARIEGTALADEHEIATQLADDLKEMGYDSKWNEEIEAKAQVLAGLVRNHIKEEENEVFKTAEKDIPAVQLDHLRDEYLEKCRLYLEDDSGATTLGISAVSRPNAQI